ncbi:MAG TPA: copper chaperone PCu(A)C [Gammaproteobacteria bacterium]|nr:copper chaperone PCu(A)C [Gammaproteobacteria bacterium]
MRRLLPLLLLLAAASAWCDGPTVRASHVWIRDAPPGIKVLAAYFTLQNLTDKPLNLVAVSSPDFDAVMLHQSVVKGGVESMLPVDSLIIPADGSVELQPGGYHVMLMQPKRNLFSGDMVTLMLTFSDKSELAILAPVRHDPPEH